MRRVTDITGNRAVTGGERPRWLPSSQGLVTAAVLVFCAVLVIYPLVYLVAESLNVGDPETFPPADWGAGNYADLIDDWHVIANTAFVACCATVLARGDSGFLAAWTLTRTKRLGRACLEKRLMELPYYMTPLVGRRLAWSILGRAAHRVPGTSSGMSGGRPWRHRQHLFAVRDRLGHGLVRGNGHVCR